jgi:hypothetical protein
MAPLPLLVIVAAILTSTVSCYSPNNIDLNTNTNTNRVSNIDVGDLLMKTRETFKLADLYDLRVRIQCPDISQRLLVDAATGSCLFHFSQSSCTDNVNKNSGSSDNTEGNGKGGTAIHKLACFQGADWYGTILARSSDIRGLVRALQEDPPRGVVNWTLDYVKLQPGQGSYKRDRESSSSSDGGSSALSKKAILCAVANAIVYPPVLLDVDARDRLLIVDTGSQTGAYLVRLHDQASSSSQPTLISHAQWSKRPFAYSSALNLDVADTIIDILLHLSQTTTDGEAATRPQYLTLLDPTCGSGTFLACALHKGMRAVGYDINPQCTEGSRNNLVHLYGAARIKSDCQLQVHDSSMLHIVSNDGDSNRHGDSQRNQHGFARIGCVACNLPWGQNSVHYSQQNTDILASIRRVVAAHVPCAFVSKQPLLDMEKLGYEVVGTAQIPQRNFVLPTGSKSIAKAGTASTTGRKTGRSDCVVTIAMTK